jgi:hypothetical protein
VLPLRSTHGGCLASKQDTRQGTDAVSVSTSSGPRNACRPGRAPQDPYVPEAALIDPIDSWLASLTTSSALAAHQDTHSASAENNALRSQLRMVEKKISALVAALEAGAEVPEVMAQLKRRQVERDALKDAISRAGTPRRVAEVEISHALDRLGGVSALLRDAEPGQRQAVYESLGLRIDYNHFDRAATVRADLACVQTRVRRGT